ncbi:murein L,D-transpeptidase catalytic domain family protein [Flavitalea sp. BT771]|uniref:murein L,D-transpeptidase catalytic domain family protein n=1 Tax=Flavitalea sp. BT771 TaxID=3063329 RepID=UPI0026E42CC5|nr:murein L,D-transpeptidase catalytic domain family protein [Flavitalea sp. BT771]MDO6431112.1 murein L,D-transpeptidase catalytic domain family protein [Flavitalea sp. BT771]MDV6220019.1 murein L,D-transpeptidase catalytic domain family protein [Flavitalea sp. BT771]
MVKSPSRRTVKFVNVLCLSLAAFFFLSFLPLAPAPSPTPEISSVHSKTAKAAIPNFSYADSSRLNILYNSLQLDSLGLSMEAFHKGIAGFLSLVLSGEVRNPGVLSIIDFSKPSTQKRLFVLDMYNETLIFNSLVAHGRNSGKLLATRFSNRPNSYMSSLGFYLTGEPFIGQHGYSLRLEGKEKGWNDNALHRSIIMHPADYVSEDHIRQWGYLGRSEGCPAIPEDLDKSLIDIIRGGSCLFIYSPDIRYLHRSRLAS